MASSVSAIIFRGIVHVENSSSAIAHHPGLVAAFAGSAISAPDKYTLQVPGGLAFSEFKGYEDWQAVSVSLSEDAFALILANPIMIEAYRAGAPGNGKPFPDGAKMAKIIGSRRRAPRAPAPTQVAGALHDVDFMERDSKRFAGSGNWGYAQFDYDDATNTFKPEGEGAECGFSCHTIVAAKDYVFTAYPKR
ncbi:MAG: cytochrome P460 family protein [Hyphomicrobium sp.]